MKSDCCEQNNPLDEVKTYTMLMHLSQLAAYVLPIIGWCVPIIMWALKRDQEIVNQHGKTIFNWMLSAALYSVGLLILSFIMPLLSVPLLFLLGLASIALIILAAINANQGQVKQYPLAIQFFK